jgi:anti-sigma factor RsiW
VAFAEWHPDDERLLNRYLDPTDRDDTLDRHLHACSACARRLRVLRRELDVLHQRAADLADLAFDDARLARQRASIVERLGGSVRGRLLEFPAERARPWTPTLPPFFVRAIAAAAMVLMVLAFGAGHLVSPWKRSSFAEPVSAGTLSPATATHAAEDLFFADIDLALAQPRTAELRAIDEFTPHAPDAVVAAR